MPELPEVETVVRTLRPHVQGLTLLCAREIRPCALKGSLPFERAEGAKVCLVRRRGKLAVLELAREEGRLFLCVHLRMTGSLLAREGLAIADSRALEALAGPRTRAVFGFAEGASWPCTVAVCFDDVRTFGRILAGGERELAAWPFWRTLGPEPLDMDAGAFRAVLRGRRCIKALLLDQKVIAGVGNIYADESLFAAGIHPETPADRLSGEDRDRLFRSLRQILEKAVAECGSSFSDYRDANGNPGSFQNSFAVYGRAGEPCRACGRTLARIKVAGRGSVVCPHCQRKQRTKR